MNKLTYNLDVSKLADRLMNKHFKKDKKQKLAVWKKINQVLEKPHMFKPLKNVLKGQRRVHIGSFVLFYKINENTKTVEVYNYKHHDDAYRK